MMVPVPQLLKIVVVKHIEGIIPTKKFLKEEYYVSFIANSNQEYLHISKL